MTNRFFDLTFERLPSGTIRLKQSAFDEDSVIDLHPAQLEHVARALLGSCDPGRLNEMERRIAVLADKAQDVVCSKAFRSDLIERCGDGFEYLARLDALVDLALEFDGGRLEPEYKPEQTEQNVPRARTSTLPSTQASASKDNAPLRMETAGEPDVGQLQIAGL